MKLKHATIAVITLIIISIISTIMLSFFPRILGYMYDFKISTFIYIAKEISLLSFFIILLKNQK